MPRCLGWSGPPAPGLKHSAHLRQLGCKQRTGGQKPLSCTQFALLSRFPLNLARCLLCRHVRSWPVSKCHRTSCSFDLKHADDSHATSRRLQRIQKGAPKPSSPRIVLGSVNLASCVLVTPALCHPSKLYTSQSVTTGRVPQRGCRKYVQVSLPGCRH